MKKLTALFLVCVLVLSLAACGGGGTDAPKPDDKPTSSPQNSTVKPADKPTDKPADKPQESPAGSAELTASGEWTGLCQRYVGDGSGDYESEFTLKLEKDGTGTHYRDDLEISVTWTQDGSNVTMQESYLGMTIEYAGTVDGDALSLFNGDPTDDFTVEFVYGRGDNLTRPEPPARADEIFNGDWQGLGKFTSCTGGYADIEGVYSDVFTRFLCGTGGVAPFIGVTAGNPLFSDLSCDLDYYDNTLTIDGKWGANYFYNCVAKVENGTMHFEIPIEDDNGSFVFIVNLRHFGDQGWTDEDPGFTKELAEHYKDMTLEYIAGYYGYSTDELPTEAPADIWW